MDEEEHPIFGNSPPKSRLNWGQIIVVSLFVALIVAIAIILALAISLGVVNARGVPSPSQQSSIIPIPSSSYTPTPTPTPSPVPCLTESCITLASTVLANLDTSVQPCDDFYNFTCGGWVENHVLPSGVGRLDTFDALIERNQIKLRKILESDKGDHVEAVLKVKHLYRSCMNTTAINDVGAAPLIGILDMIDGWNLVGLNGTWGLNTTGFAMEKWLNSPAFFSIDVEPDDKDTNKNVLVLTQSGLSLPSAASYLDNTTGVANLMALRELMLSVLVLINPNNTDNYTDAVDEMINLEQNLAEIWVSNVALRNPVATYNVYSIANLSTLWDMYDWSYGLNLIFSLSSTTLGDNDRVIVRTPSYFLNLTSVLSEASDDVLENYAKWQLVMNFLPLLSEDFTSVYYKFTQSVMGSGEKERYRTCIDITQRVLPIALARPYTDYILPSGTKEEVSVMIEGVKTAFKERLAKQTWITAETRQACKEKVDSITKMVAYPDMIQNNTYLNNLYAAYNISEDNYFENIVGYIYTALTENQGQILKPVDKTVWLNAPTAVNAYYSPLFNQFVFLEGILNMPFFEAGWPSYFKYGAVGVVIGHELTHGFDDQGQQYNAEGILTQWWDANSTANFKERQACFVEQYDQYQLFGFNVSGKLTLGENIADNGGVKSAFQAFKDIVSADTSPQLPALTNYTSDQLYYIAFGQLWCSLFSPQYISSSTKTDVHSPGPYRVIGALVNDPDFATTFGCKEGSRMNPTKKCPMW